MSNSKNEDTKVMPAGKVAAAKVREEEVAASIKYKEEIVKRRQEAAKEIVGLMFEENSVEADKFWNEFMHKAKESERGMKAYDNIVSNMMTLVAMAEELNAAIATYNIPGLLWKGKGVAFDAIKNKIKSKDFGKKIVAGLGKAKDAILDSALAEKLGAVEQSMVNRGWVKPDEVDEMPDITMKFGLNDKNEFMIDFEATSKITGKRKIEDKDAIEDLQKMIQEWIEKRGYTYNPATKKILDEDGKELTNEEFQLIANDPKNGLKPFAEERTEMHIFLMDVLTQFMPSFSDEDKNESEPAPGP